MTLAKALAYIEDDELVGLMPKSIRLRETFLDPKERKRMERSNGGAGEVPREHSHDTKATLRILDAAQIPQPC